MHAVQNSCKTLSHPAAGTPAQWGLWVRGGHPCIAKPDFRDERSTLKPRLFAGFPLRKDFPMRGRFSRSEQLKQALAANPEARYSMEELSIADAFEDLPTDMRSRLKGGEKTGE